MTVEKDWIFRGEDYTCGLRAAGVLLRDGMLLVQRDVQGTEYALPGGHVRIGETTEQALIREYREEMGVEITHQRLLWTEECFWHWNGSMNHSLCFYYKIEAAADAFLPPLGAFVPHRDNARVEVGWLPVSELNQVVLYPEFLKDHIHHLDAAPSHHITYA